MNYYNPYFGQQIMPQMTSTPVQSIQQVQKSAQFYNVENAQELDGIRPILNVLYVGFNKKKKEIYIKQLTNDGLISLETYNLADDKKEKSELETILEKINNIERRLSNDTTNAGTEIHQRTVAESSTNATSQSNVAGQDTATTTSNAV